jgi:hypothetical protein
MDTPKYATARIWVQTLRTLKLIAALTNESMVKVMDRLAKQELERLQNQQDSERQSKLSC